MCVPCHLLALECSKSTDLESDLLSRYPSKTRRHAITILPSLDTHHYNVRQNKMRNGWLDMNDEQYADGFAYNKAKLEEAFRTGGFLEKPPAKVAKDPAIASLKKEDIDLVVRVATQTQICCIPLPRK